MKPVRAEKIAYYFGQDAAMTGRSRDSNPYDSNYFLHEWWYLGWYEWEGE